jgi:protease II
MGTLHRDDVLFYEETNPDFKVQVEQTLSGEFIMLNIRSTF